MLSDTEKGKIAGGQQDARLVSDFHRHLAGSMPPMADDSGGGDGAALGTANKVYAAVEGDIFAAIISASGTAGAIGQGVIGAAVATCMSGAM